MLRVIVTCCVMLAACGGGVNETVQTGDASVNAWPELQSPVERDPAIEMRIDELLSQMSTEQKVGQMIQGEIQYLTPDDVGRYHLGSVLNGGGSFPGKDKQASVSDWVELADAFHDASLDASDGGPAIPVIWGTDSVHGVNNVFGATLFPHNIGLGATRNRDLIQRIGEATALETAVIGIPWTFAPTLAVVRDDRWGRTYEGYSEDPQIVEDYAGAMVTGLQGALDSDGFLDDSRVLSTAKHFLGDGGTENGVDQGNNLLDDAELFDVHGRGYVTALSAGVRVIMVSYNSSRGQKLHGHRYLLTDILKGRMGFDGFLIGDWNGHSQVEGCSNESCAAAINAGIDMIMVPEHWRAFYENTLQQVESGEISMARVDDAVRRILRVKLEAGLFEAGRPSTRAYAGRTEHLGSPEHRALARQAVRESLVLLKNNDSLLPLDPGANILVAGPSADDIAMQSGGWTLSWQGTDTDNDDFPGATTIFAGIRDAVTAAGGTATHSADGSYEARPDVAIVVWGEPPYAECFGDRKHLNYDATDPESLEILQRLRDDGIPVVSVFLSGRALWVNPHLNASTAFVAAWLPGSEGNGVADVLFRAPDGTVQHDFKGTLSFSWPRTVEQNVLNVGSEPYDPLFPYGYGLTYAEQQQLSDDLSTDSGNATTALDQTPMGSSCAN